LTKEIFFAIILYQLLGILPLIAARRRLVEERKKKGGAKCQNNVPRSVSHAVNNIFFFLKPWEQQ